MSICLITIPFVGCQKMVVIVLLILVEMSNGLVSGGDIPIVAEMTAEFAATIFSIMNTVSSCAGLVSPLIVGLIIEPDPFSLTLWSYVFYLAAFLSSLGTLTFIAFASAQPQNWGK